MTDLISALGKLDPKDDDHWTDDGMPRMDVLQALTGDNSLTRKQVTDAKPDLTRETASSPLAKDLANQKAAMENKAAEVQAAVEAAEKEEADFAKAKAKVKAAPKPAPTEPTAAEPQDVDTRTDPEKAQDTLEAMEAEREVLTEKMLAAQKRQSEAKDEADALANMVNHLTNHIAEQRRRVPNHDTKHIRDYLKAQHEARLAKSLALQAFLKQTGVTPGQAASMTNPKAPIDQAMNARKAGLGQGRKTRPPVR